MKTTGKKLRRSFALILLSVLVAVCTVLTSCSSSDETTESDTVAVTEPETTEETTGEETEELTTAEPETTEAATEEETASEPETAASPVTTAAPVTTSATAEHEHNFGDWKTVKAPTCTEEGKKERTCSCGEKETAVIAATGHTAVTDKAVAATCTQPGKTEGSHCSTCGVVIKAQETVPAKGHTEVKDNAVEATCSSTGKTEGSHCSVCGVIIKAQETIPAKEHTVVADEAVEATCSSEGKTAGSHCSVCGAVIEAQETIPAKEHTPVADEAVEPTCTEPGKAEGSHCSVCGAVIKEQTEIAPLGHDYKDGVCTRCGEKPKIDVILESKDALAGEEISISISLANNPGISSLKVKIKYGDLEYKSAKIPFASDMEGVELMTTVKNNEENHQVNLNWISPEENISENGVFATLTFTVPADAAADTRYDIEAVIDPNDVFDYDYNNVDFSIISGSVTVID